MPPAIAPPAVTPAMITGFEVTTAATTAAPVAPAPVTISDRSKLEQAANVSVNQINNIHFILLLLGLYI